MSDILLADVWKYRRWMRLIRMAGIYANPNNDSEWADPHSDYLGWLRTGVLTKDGRPVVKRTYVGRYRQF